MTRKELITLLLDGDMNEEIYIAVTDIKEESEEIYSITFVNSDVIGVSI